MITIDMLDEHVSLPEKPEYLNYAPVLHVAPGNYLPMHEQAQAYHRELIHTAHKARLLKAAKSSYLAQDVYNLMQGIVADINTLAERYLRRSLR